MMRMRRRDLGVEGVWWSPRSSKPLRPDFVGLGGFDSHTLPPSRLLRALRGYRRVVVACVALAISLAISLAAGVRSVRAQTIEGGRVGVTRPDSGAAPSLQVVDLLERPPITPRRAFFYSLALPGVGQARLDRAYAGGFFILVEVASLALVRRSVEDLRIARAFRDDSMPATYQIDGATGIVARDSLGAPIVTTWARSRYTNAWVRTRRLQVEDWMALLIFNHLFAGADAFVAAQLWDLPAKVGLQETPNGPAIGATFSFGRARR